MTNITKAAQDALEALIVARDQTCSVGRPKDWAQINDAITTLREALKELAVPVFVAQERVIDEYLDDYEMIGETEDGRDACYTPTEGERGMIKDAIMGLLSADEWSAVAALQDKAGEVREPSESRVCRSDLVESDRQDGLSISDAVQVCPYKDADCGDRPANWCDKCPKRLAAQPAPVVPDGCACVGEPTQAMIVAAQCAYWPGMEVPNVHCITRALKAAMLTASQQKGGK